MGPVEDMARIGPLLDAASLQIISRRDLPALGQTMFRVKPAVAVSDCDIQASLEALNLDVVVDVSNTYELLGPETLAASFD